MPFRTGNATFLPHKFIPSATSKKNEKFLIAHSCLCGQQEYEHSSDGGLYCCHKSRERSDAVGRQRSVPPQPTPVGGLLHCRARWSEATSSERAASEAMRPADTSRQNPPPSNRIAPHKSACKGRVLQGRTQGSVRLYSTEVVVPQQGARFARNFVRQGQPSARAIATRPLRAISIMPMSLTIFIKLSICEARPEISTPSSLGLTVTNLPLKISTS